MAAATRQRTATPLVLLTLNSQAPSQRPLLWASGVCPLRMARRLSDDLEARILKLHPEWAEILKLAQVPWRAFCQLQAPVCSN